MPSEDLNAAEISTREKLKSVRAALVSTVAALEDSERAKAEVLGEGGPSADVYRRAADERSEALRVRIANTRLAESERERLRAEENELLVELERIRRDLEDAGVSRVVFPTLRGIPLAAPCTMRWQDMKGDGDERMCTRCKKIVRSPVMLSTADEGKFTVDLRSPFYRRIDGTIIAGNCADGESQRRLNWVMTVVLASLILVVGGGVAVSALTKSDRKLAHRVPSPTPEISRTAQTTWKADQVALLHASQIHIADTSISNGANRSVDFTLWRQPNDEFVFSLSCGQQGPGFADTVAAQPVLLFLEDVNELSKSQTTPEAPCPDSDTQRRITVDVTTSQGMTSLSTKSCPNQWYAGGEPLSLDLMMQRDHPSLVAQHYDDLIRILPVRECLEKISAPSKTP